MVGIISTIFDATIRSRLPPASAVGLGSHGVALRLRQLDRPVGLGIGRLLHLRHELRFALLGLLGRQGRLLFGDLLRGLGLGQRPGLISLCLGGLHLGPSPRLFDLGIPREPRFLGVGLLLSFGCGLVGLSLRDPGVLLYLGDVGCGEVLDVSRGSPTSWI